MTHRLRLGSRSHHPCPHRRRPHDCSCRCPLGSDGGHLRIFSWATSRPCHIPSHLHTWTWLAHASILVLQLESTSANPPWASGFLCVLLVFSSSWFHVSGCTPEDLHSSVSWSPERTPRIGLALRSSPHTDTACHGEWKWVWRAHHPILLHPSLTVQLLPMPHHVGNSLQERYLRSLCHDLDDHIALQKAAIAYGSFGNFSGWGLLQSVQTWTNQNLSHVLSVNALVLLLLLLFHHLRLLHHHCLACLQHS